MHDFIPICTNLDLYGMRIDIPWRLNDVKTLRGEKFESFKRVLQALNYPGANFAHDVVISGAKEYECLSTSER
jgi:hypothetical protein